MERRMECHQTVTYDSLMISVIHTIKVITIQKKDHLIRIIFIRRIIYNYEKWRGCSWGLIQLSINVLICPKKNQKNENPKTIILKDRIYGNFLRTILVEVLNQKYKL